MSRYIFDIETDGLLDTCTVVWIVSLLNIDSLEIISYPIGDDGWKKRMSEATLLAGHNILGFDFPALQKIAKWERSKHTTVQDTLLMSQILDYNRFNGEHSLEAWGRYFGEEKIAHEDWTQYSPEMKLRNVGDVKLNFRVWKKLMQEFDTHYAKYPNIGTYIRAEHYVADWCAKAQEGGWPFKVYDALDLFEKMGEELESTRDALLPKLGIKTVATDKKKGEVEAKRPKWLLNGNYDAHTCRWFGIEPNTGLDDDRLIEGEFCRVEFLPLSLDSSDDVKVFLYRNGWEPTEWNFKKVEKFDPVKNEIRTFSEQTSPKITEDSLEFLGGDGKLYVDFLSTKSRFGVMNTWLGNVDGHGRLHGSCFTIGTPSMRSRHNIIANIPSADASWGKEIRSLFTVKPGWKFIGADSSGNQARGLAHYLKSEEFIDILLNKDIHQYNADILTSILRTEFKLDHTVPRSVAKRILYAFLFGASGAKLWMYIFGVSDKTKGNKLKKGFIKAVPGFKQLTDELETTFAGTSKYGKGYIRSIAGNKIYCDSFHKLLVYLLQACEKVTCSAALMLTVRGLEAEGIPYEPLILYHDELDFMVPEEYAERAAAIAKNAFKEGPRLFEIQIMDGEAKIGNDWYECH